MKALARLTGQHHERQAANYLQKQGLQLIERNYRCRGGEIDLVMRDCDALVFIEVRYRSNSSHGCAAETVTAGKQQKILHAARYFLSHNPGYQQMPCRFDVLGIDNGQTTQYTWLQNAFTE